MIGVKLTFAGAPVVALYYEHSSNGDEKLVLFRGKLVFVLA